jgi:hypothetical protein
MKTPAQAARENAISFEVKKDGLSQRQNGDWVLRLYAQAKDMQPQDIKDVFVNANMGTRFICSLAQIGDDEMPVDHIAIERDKWRGLGPTRQAGIRCGDPVFWAWLEEEGYPRGIRHVCASNDDAATIVRALCGVASRSDFNRPGFTEHRVKWYDIDNAFRGWKAKENA